MRRLRALLSTLAGYVSIPHELLHVLALVVMRKRYTYRIGDLGVHPVDPLGLDQTLFFYLLPLCVSAGYSLVLMFVWSTTFISSAYSPQTYLLLAPLWHKGVAALSYILLVYAGGCVRDVQASFALVRHRPA